jgi:hypothetical protein
VNRLALSVIVLALALGGGACGGDDRRSEGAADTGVSADTGAAPSAGAPIPGGGLSIAEAIDSTLEGPLMVKGHIVAPEGEPIRLCSALLESYPPQCGEPSLVVEGLDLATVDGLTSTDNSAVAQVSWSDAVVSLLGTVEEGVMTVSETSLG